MLQKSGRLVLWEAMFILELHSAETQEYFIFVLYRKKSGEHSPDLFISALFHLFQFKQSYSFALPAGYPRQFLLPFYPPVRLPAF